MSKKASVTNCAGPSMTHPSAPCFPQTRPLPNSFFIPEEALVAFALMENAGYEAWLVGGFVRNQLLLLDKVAAERNIPDDAEQSSLISAAIDSDKTLPFYDLDMATNASWQETQKVFEEAGFRTHETGIQHGTLTVIVKDLPLEITTYRTDGIYLDGRHPERVSFVKTIEEDLARRDFTMNAIAAHPERGLLDPFVGVSDIQNGIIRSVGNAEKRFSEDALRILRGCRFASQLGFAIEDHTAQAMLRTKGQLTKISAERIFSELQKLLTGKHAGKTLVEQADVLSVCLPELVSMKGFNQNTPYHIYDVLEHTAHVVDATPRTPLLRWSALFHDMGKPATYFTDEKGTGHFYQHPAVSVALSQGIMQRLKFPRTLRERVLLLVAEHDKVVERTPRAIKRAVNRLNEEGDLFLALCDLKKADASGQAPRCVGRIADAEALKNAYLELKASGDAFGLKDLAISGKDLIAQGLAPGPLIGQALSYALEEVLEERCENTKEALFELVLTMVDSRGFSPD